MADAVDRGQAFDIDDLWRPSTFTIPAFGEKDALEAWDLDLLNIIDTPSDADLISGPFDFKVLQLDNPDDAHFTVQTELEDHELFAEALPSTAADSTSGDDIWDVDADALASKKLPSYCTWEAFERKDDVNAGRPVYLSEAGNGAFDAAMAHWQPHSSSGVSPQDISLRALCNLALGRSSIFYKWDATKECFEQTLQDVPISGLSLQCSTSFVAALMEYGTLYRRLLATSTPRVAEKTPTLMALKRCVTEVLDVVDSYLSGRLAGIRSLLQLQEAIETSRLLVTTLTELVGSITDVDTDEEALSIIGDRVYSIAESGSRLVSVVRTMLARVSLPWLHSLQEDLGLAEAGHMTTTSATGACRILDGPGLQSLASGRLSSMLINDADRRLITDTKKSLDIARQHLDLSRGESATSFPLLAHADSATYGRVAQDFTISGSLRTVTNDVEDVEPDFSRLEGLDAPNSAVEVSDLGRVTLAALALPITHSPGQFDDPRLSLDVDPLADLRPSIQLQSRKLNHLILRHIFRTCDLMKHLNIQHQFQLLGGGHFVAKLSTVLFSSDTQSAERTRENMPTGATMGLRLNARPGQRWPPASSELRLSLMGLLDDAHRSDFTNYDDSHGQHTVLPGGLSFAIRELSDAEIDRVMDPTSLHALDFLRLQYAAPPPLDNIITPASSLKYDEIFRFLLPLLRVQYVTTRLQAEITSRNHNGRDVAHRICVQMHHVSSVISTYVMHIGIAAPWTDFITKVKQIEETLADADPGDADQQSTNIGLTALCDIHDACLETIRSRLFLKRKQGNIRSAVEDVLSLVLKVTSKVASESGPDAGSIQELSSQLTAPVQFLVSTLQETIDKPPRAKGNADATEDDSDALQILLGELDWNHYYTTDQ